MNVVPACREGRVGGRLSVLRPAAVLPGRRGAGWGVSLSGLVSQRLPFHHRGGRPLIPSPSLSDVGGLGRGWDMGLTSCRGFWGQTDEMMSPGAAGPAGHLSHLLAGRGVPARPAPSVCQARFLPCGLGGGGS